MEIINTVIENWPAIVAAAVAVVVAAEKVARLTPTESDNKVVRTAYKVFKVLGVKVEDRVQ